MDHDYKESPLNLNHMENLHAVNNKWIDDETISQEVYPCP